MNDRPQERAKRDRIERLRKRLGNVQWDGSRDDLVAVLKGILDLLADEL
jgi:hypothetical protein